MGDHLLNSTARPLLKNVNVQFSAILALIFILTEVLHRPGAETGQGGKL